jgi:hypothetical protein
MPTITKSSEESCHFLPLFRKGSEEGTLAETDQRERSLSWDAMEQALSSLTRSVLFFGRSALGGEYRHADWKRNNHQF